MKRVDIGLLGCGTVGCGFVQLLDHERTRVRNRYDIDLSITRIAVRDLHKPRPGVDVRLLTTSTLDAIQAGDIVVEAIGGVELPRSLVRTAIALGRDVVTANKALLAESGPEIFAKAAARGVAVGFEASVCGGIPVIRALQRGLAGDSIESVTGILNGTCNFVLTRMEDGTSFDAALQLAQERGFAEADPSLDVDGHDAAQKLQLLAAIAFEGQRPATLDVTGIRGVTSADVAAARERGSVLRQVAVAEECGGTIHLRVGVREVPDCDPLARVRDESNAVVIRGRSVGDILLTGRGAGAMPTAAAILSDVIEIALLRVREEAAPRLRLARAV
ncbi:MAG TPA: homoserine dehydrogenase [Thermoanaerobaculia bacterium]|jgi:homoserine dehydrogenase|nr:homoserine dehydrogenase [Thermoanaerobaculia bacterium]